MSTYKDNWYDVTVECDVCHDLYDCEIQLYSAREVALVKELVIKLITRCHNCGAEQSELTATVSNEYFTVQEINKIRDKESKWRFLYRRHNNKKDNI